MNSRRDQQTLMQGSASTILAQRCRDIFRTAIRLTPDRGLTISLDRFDPETLGHDTLLELSVEQWAEATALLCDLKDAIPEASRALQMWQRLTPDENEQERRAGVV